MGGYPGRDEELRAVCVGSGVGHREQAGLGVIDLEVLVIKLAAFVDRLAAASISEREVTCRIRLVSSSRNRALVQLLLTSLEHETISTKKVLARS